MMVITHCGFCLQPSFFVLINNYFYLSYLLILFHKTTHSLVILYLYIYGGAFKLAIFKNWK